ncbi:MAG: stage II sporulation protein P [Lachnospiraceae bacterium]
MRKINWRKIALCICILMVFVQAMRSERISILDEGQEPAQVNLYHYFSTQWFPLGRYVQNQKNGMGSDICSILIRETHPLQCYVEENLILENANNLLQNEQEKGGEEIERNFINGVDENALLAENNAANNASAQQGAMMQENKIESAKQDAMTQENSSQQGAMTQENNLQIESAQQDTMQDTSSDSGLRQGSDSAKQENEQEEPQMDYVTLECFRQSAVASTSLNNPVLNGMHVTPIAPAQSKSVIVSQSTYQDYASLLQNYYVVDAGTSANSAIFNAKQLLSVDLSIDRDTDGPQILIYHTHSQEGFADSVPGDESTTIVGAGELLANILTDCYGYEVYHHTGRYDTEHHSYAYSYAEPEIAQILEDNPSIQVVIDLHRDEVAENTKLLADVNGVEMAQFMLFNGLSYVNGVGDISYLPNPNLQKNLAFSLQMQITANEYYPGLARRIYLKGYRYNMHLAQRYLLIELGAQTNTVEEVQNACYPLADIIDKTLRGNARYL